jgi:hypothetical protein
MSKRKILGDGRIVYESVVYIGNLDKEYSSYAEYLAEYNEQENTDAEPMSEDVWQARHKGKTEELKERIALEIQRLNALAGEIKFKIEKCPSCGNQTLVQIVYGLVRPNPENPTYAAMQRGEIVLGGYLEDDANSRTHYCKSCGGYFFLPIGANIEDGLQKAGLSDMEEKKFIEWLKKQDEEKG